jgi:hypothetical protein
MIKHFLLLLCALALAACGDARLKCWRVDPLVKVFPDDTRDSSQSGDAVPLMARNGHATIQFAVRSPSGIADLNAALDMSGPVVAQLRHVGYVPVASNPPKTPADELVRPAPALYPDPLFADFPFLLKPKRTESLWITLYAPPDTAPGEYSGTLKLSAGDAQIARLPFTVKVTAAVVPAHQSLQVTNWLELGEKPLGRHFKLGQDPEAYWRLLSNIGRVMAEHRQNVLITPVYSLVDTKIDGGRIHYDFAKLDRWVDTFEKAGLLGTIEGGHLMGRRADSYDGSMIVPSYVIENGKVVKQDLDTTDPRSEQYLNTFLPALYAHIKEKGWTGRYIQHIHDEPHGKEAPIYNRFATLIRKNLPGIPTIDAVGLDQDISFFADVSDIWVPVLGSFDQKLDTIHAHVAKGGQAWFYTCIAPQGRHLNRFIDLPLLKTRLLHWFNYRHGFTGYLHWGGNYWGPAPFLDVQPVINDNETLLPAGDNAIVYPDPAHNSVLSSIRLEAMRDGIEDYELLTALAQRDPAKARRLAAAAIPNITDYVRSVPEFRALQRQLVGE